MYAFSGRFLYSMDVLAVIRIAANITGSNISSDEQQQLLFQSIQFLLNNAER